MPKPPKNTRKATVKRVKAWMLKDIFINKNKRIIQYVYGNTMNLYLKKPKYGFSDLYVEVIITLPPKRSKKK